MELKDWKVFGGTAELERTHMKVDHVDFEIVVQDTTSRDAENNEVPFLFTDLQFQPGATKTGWNPNTKEFLDRIEYDADETKNYQNADGSLNPFFVWKTVTPTIYPNKIERMFNLMGRGHEVITLPNDLPEEVFWELDKIAQQGLERPVEILSTGIDFTIIPKEDFDLCRISTNIGSLLPEDERHYQPILDEYSDATNLTAKSTVESLFVDHPLHRRYTREFWFEGGQAGDILETHASITTARHNGVEIETNGVRTINIGTGELDIYKNKFQLIPRGSVRFRVEFYRQVDLTIGMKNDNSIKQTVQYLKDDGIGFGGMAKFNQWTYGVERL